MAVSLFARVRVEVMLAVAGCAHALTFAPDPLPYWSLAIVQVLALAILVHSVRDADSVWLAALRGWWFGLVSFSVGLYWLFISMNHYGGLPAPLAAVGVVGLSAFLALFTGFSCGLFVWLRPVSVRGKVWLDVLTWSSVWAGAEWLRSILFSGFPWLNIGYAHVDSALAGWAPLLGVHGIGFFAAFVAAALSILLRPSAAQQKSTVSVVIIALTLLFAGQLLMRVDWSSAHGTPLNIRLVQIDFA